MQCSSAKHIRRKTALAAYRWQFYLVNTLFQSLYASLCPNDLTAIEASLMVRNLACTGDQMFPETRFEARVMAAQAGRRSRAVLTNGHTGHVPTAHGPRIFFLFEGPPTGCGERNYLKLIILLLMLLHDRTNTSKIDLQ